MGKKAEAKACRYQDIPGFSETRNLAQSITAPFLRQRALGFVDSATALVECLSRTFGGAGNAGPVPASVAQFGKDARLLDLVLSIAGSSGHLPMEDKIKAQKIRLSAENKLAKFGSFENGLLIVSGPEGEIREETQSSFGRTMAGFFARFVFPDKSDAIAAPIAREAFLPRATQSQIQADLASAQEHLKAGRMKEAAELYNGVLKRERKNNEALRGLGRLCLMSGQAALGLECLRQLRLLEPRNADALADTGTALSGLGRYEEACAVFEEAVKLLPEDAFVALNYGIALFMIERDDAAKTHLDRALRLAPNSAAVLTGVAAFHQFRHEYEKAAFYALKAVNLDPHYAWGLHNYAALLSAQQKKKEALEYLDRALAIYPNHADILFTKAMVLLSEGEYRDGFALYEHGLGNPKKHRKCSADLFKHNPLWKGEAGPGIKLLIRTEQGLGDSLQFIRYAKLAKERVGKVHVLCPQTLVRLFKNCPYIDKVSTSFYHWQSNKQIATLSLPHVFGTTLETVPADIPYLFVPAGEKEKWGEKVGAAKKMKVGIVWSGSMFAGSVRGDLRAKHRNMELRQLLPLFDFKDISFVNLQFEKGASEIDELGLRSRVIDLMPQVKDMLDTAAIVDHLDLVISVDTSIAHLAGGLGKEVWVLSRFDCCWRWLKNRPDNRWYPTARVFGQPKAGDWGTVVANVREALAELVKARQAGA